MKTKVINLISGSGAGKSTAAAGIFAELKLRGYSTELVTEYVKSWPWQGRKITPFDVPLIFGKQSQREAILYGKVDFIVTDSPLLLSPVYDEFYNGTSSIGEFTNAFLCKATESGVDHVYYFLKRNKPFVQAGRYEDAETAVKVDEFVKHFLTQNKIPFVEVEVDDRERPNFILKHLGALPYKGC